ncbi:MAG: biopolymer transporter ExbD [Deltaproteobacteria bacterium]|nr:biopolymer transporter ExbD [Deltaproteobacteria bacterium]
MQFRRSRKDDARIDITPLVDMVFLLLIFFMLSTTFIVTPGIKVNLPHSSAETVTHEKREVQVAITEDNKVFWEKILVDEKELEQRLMEVAREDSQTLIIIRADAKALHGKVVEVMDIAKQAGLNRLAIATYPKEKEGARQ